MAVVNQLKNRQVCSYRDIASLIVQNFDPSASHREKNSIRRRAYDVINVMSAVGIVRKKKKRFFTVESFIGVDVRDLERKRDEVVKRMKEKEMELNDMLIILEEENAKSAMKPALNFKMKHQEDKENIPILRVKEEPLDDVQAVIVEPVNQNKLSFCHQRSSLLELDKSQCESNPNTSQDLIVVDPNIHAFTRYHDDYEDQDEYFDCEVEVQSEEKPNIDLTVQEAFTSFYWIANLVSGAPATDIEKVIICARLMTTLSMLLTHRFLPNHSSEIGIGLRNSAVIFITNLGHYTTVVRTWSRSVLSGRMTV